MSGANYRVFDVETVGNFIHSPSLIGYGYRIIAPIK